MSSTSPTKQLEQLDKAEKVTLPTVAEIERLNDALRTVTELACNFRWRIARSSEWEEFVPQGQQVQVATVEDIGRLFSAYEHFAGRLHEAHDYTEDVRKGYGHLSDLDVARIERTARDG